MESFNHNADIWVKKICFIFCWRTSLSNVNMISSNINFLSSLFSSSVKSVTKWTNLWMYLYVLISLWNDKTVFHWSKRSVRLSSVAVDSRMTENNCYCSALPNCLVSPANSVPLSFKSFWCNNFCNHCWQQFQSLFGILHIRFFWKYDSIKPLLAN